MRQASTILRNVERGFESLAVSKRYKDSALKYLEEWLTRSDFKDYVPQIKHLISAGSWDYLLDSFYQVIPFGTGGRRGEVGIGPNRINPWTIKASAQGHCQYLLKKYDKRAGLRGVVFAYDVREFFANRYFNDSLPNPVKNLRGVDLARFAAEVYAANNIKILIFDGIRTTPELSFAIRHLGAVGGVMFSASHNPPDHNGKKVYDEFGGQLIPPDDEELVVEVTQKVRLIKRMPYEEAVKKGLVEVIKTDLDDAYIKAAASVSLSEARDVKIAYSPLHGCGLTSIPKALRYLGFRVSEDPKTSSPSGRFENITFNIPNPEVRESFETPLSFAKQEDADILLSSDPDADRIGIMVKHQDEWVFLNGNEIGAILAEYVTQKRGREVGGSGTIIKTTVTTNLIKNICRRNGLNLVGELLIGFKYIANELNKLARQGRIDNFLLGCEESHGYLAGNYARDKDAAAAAVWLAELTAELKQGNKTLVDYLDQVYSKYGYFRNYLTEIRLLGASGEEKIRRIQDTLREHPPTAFGKFRVKDFEDCLRRTPIVSQTDRTSKDVLIFHLAPTFGTDSLKVTVRPSGTEPKIKMYFEVGTPPVKLSRLTGTKRRIERVLRELEKSVMQACYQIIDVDLPDRGFLLFWQLPLADKLKYFKIEPEIEQLKNEKNKNRRRQKLYELISFLGSDPVEKIDQAFKAKNKLSVLDYLDISDHEKLR